MRKRARKNNLVQNAAHRAAKKGWKTRYTKLVCFPVNHFREMYILLLKDLICFYDFTKYMTYMR